jgi:hypothetical protein
MESLLKTKIMNQAFYEKLNERCQNAIKAIGQEEDVERWLHLASKLFKAVSIQPDGLPSIADSHFEGVLYSSIAEFHSLYIKKQNK